MASTLSIGQEPVPGYRLVRFVGRGSFGEVWEASAPGKAKAALKILELRGRRGQKEYRAIQLVKHIHHPHLVPINGIWLRTEDGSIIDQPLSAPKMPDIRQSQAWRALHQTSFGDEMQFDSFDQQPADLVIAMGLGDKNLKDRLEECQNRGKPGIGAEELLGYFEEAAKGIDFLNEPLHDFGYGRVAIQHCDIKPSNLLIVGDSTQVGDLGLAHALGQKTKKLNQAVTSFYAAPEILVGKGPGPGTDQFSLAVSYYHLRTGRLPVPCESTFKQVCDAYCRGNLDLSILPDGEREIIARATSPRPADRFPTSRKMIRQLIYLLEDHGEQPLNLEGAPPIATFSNLPSTLSAPLPEETSTDQVQFPLPSEPSLQAIGMNYELIECLHRGGRNEIWRAKPPQGREVGIVIRHLPNGIQDADLAALNILKDVDHPNLTEIEAFWFLNQKRQAVPPSDIKLLGPAEPCRLVIAGKLGEKNLHQRIEECHAVEAGLPIPELFSYMRQLAEALDHLNLSVHQANGRNVAIQHRNCRPINIVLSRRGTVRLGNYTLARTLAGSQAVVEDQIEQADHALLAPELLEGRLTRWSDQYSLAVTYLHLRLGILVVEREHAVPRLLQGMQQGRFENVDHLSPAEVEVLRGATCENPQDRFNSCRTFVTNLQRALDYASPGCTEWPRDMSPEEAWPQDWPTEGESSISLGGQIDFAFGAAVQSPSQGNPFDPPAAEPASKAFLPEEAPDDFGGQAEPVGGETTEAGFGVFNESLPPNSNLKDLVQRKLAEESESEAQPKQRPPSGEPSGQQIPSFPPAGFGEQANRKTPSQPPPPPSFGKDSSWGSPEPPPVKAEPPQPSGASSFTPPPASAFSFDFDPTEPESPQEANKQESAKDEEKSKNPPSRPKPFSGFAKSKNEFETMEDEEWSASNLQQPTPPPPRFGSGFSKKKKEEPPKQEKPKAEESSESSFPGFDFGAPPPTESKQEESSFAGFDFGAPKAQKPKEDSAPPWEQWKHSPPEEGSGIASEPPPSEAPSQQELDKIFGEAASEASGPQGFWGSLPPEDDEPPPSSQKPGELSSFFSNIPGPADEPEEPPAVSADSSFGDLPGEAEEPSFPSFGHDQRPDALFTTGFGPEAESEDDQANFFPTQGGPSGGPADFGSLPLPGDLRDSDEPSAGGPFSGIPFGDSGEQPQPETGGAASGVSSPQDPRPSSFPPDFLSGLNESSDEGEEGHVRGTRSGSDDETQQREKAPGEDKQFTAPPVTPAWMQDFADDDHEPDPEDSYSGEKFEKLWGDDDQFTIGEGGPVRSTPPGAPDNIPLAPPSSPTPPESKAPEPPPPAEPEPPKAESSKHLTAWLQDFADDYDDSEESYNSEKFEKLWGEDESTMEKKPLPPPPSVPRSAPSPGSTQAFSPPPEPTGPTSGFEDDPYPSGGHDIRSTMPLYRQPIQPPSGGGNFSGSSDYFVDSPLELEERSESRRRPGGVGSNFDSDDPPPRHSPPQGGQPKLERVEEPPFQPPPPSATMVEPASWGPEESGWGPPAEKSGMGSNLDDESLEPTIEPPAKPFSKSPPPPRRGSKKKGSKRVQAEDTDWLEYLVYGVLALLIFAIAFGLAWFLFLG